MSCSGEVLVDLRDQVGVVRAGLVEPEDGGVAGRAGTGHGELDPVADRLVLGLAGPPDVARGHLVLEQDVVVLVEHPDGAGVGDLERLVVAAVLLRRASHQAHVGDRAHRGRVVGAVLAAVVDDDLVDAGIAAVGDDGEGVGLLTARVPHVARGPDHRGHARVHDHVARHVQVGDALRVVDHGQLGALLQPLLDRVGDGLALLAAELLGAGEDAGETVAGVQPRLEEHLALLGEQLGEERLHRVTEDDRVRDLHHRGLQVQREEHSLVLGPRDLLAQERLQGSGVHEGGVDDLTGLDGHRLLEHLGVSVGGDELDAQRALLLDHGRLLVGAEVVGVHVRDVGLRVGAPLAHRVRVLAGVVLHRVGRAAVGVALAQDRVDRAALDPVVAGTHVLVLVGLGVVRVVREVEAELLQLRDRSLQLRGGGADVGQLDDVGLGGLGEVTELVQVVVDALVLGQQLGEARQDPGGEGDVAGVDGDVGLLGVRLEDREERVRRQERRLVGLGVDDLRVGHWGS